MIRTHKWAPVFFAVAMVSALGQQVSVVTQSESIGGGLSQQVMKRRIFLAERDMIAELRNTTPRMETYLQSIAPNTAAERPISDAYFLSQVDFKRGYKDSGEGRRGYQTFLFGGGDSDRRLRVNNGRSWKLFPDGFLDMLFVDLEDFDADTYDLNYEKTESHGPIVRMVFSVVPRDRHAGGRFSGKIWVEPTAFRIVEIKGTFTPHSVGMWKHTVGGNVPLYFAFDSVRQQVAPNVWMPWYTSVDDDRTWKDLGRNGETDFHYRGHIFIWGYRDIMSDHMGQQESDPVARLEGEKLLARPGVVEQKLDDIVQKIIVANDVGPRDIECRVILTTPIEIFHAGHTIILSRGLLNILPDDSLLPVLLAREIAEMRQAYGTDLESDSAAWNTAFALTNKAGFPANTHSLTWLSSQLQERAKQIPNLLRARFGRNLLDLLKIEPGEANDGQPALPLVLTLRGKYTINGWNSSVELSDEFERDSTARNDSHLDHEIMR